MGDLTCSIFFLFLSLLSFTLSYSSLYPSSCLSPAIQFLHVSSECSILIFLRLPYPCWLTWLTSRPVIGCGSVLWNPSPPPSCVSCGYPGILFHAISVKLLSKLPRYFLQIFFKSLKIFSKIFTKITCRFL